MRRHWPWIMIIVAYLIVGTLYAIYTPAWQVPDEPAHYNYIRSLAEGRGIPVMEPQDYDQAYIEQLTAERFPPHLSITPLTYEDHQPPLYYLLATPFFRLFDGDLLPLRLFSVALGAVVVAMALAIAQEVFPQRPGLVWLAGGLVAFLPQHTAMMAGVNNDALTEALLGLWLWLALRYLRGAAHPAVLSGVLGALLLTKTTGYVALPLTLLVAGLHWRRGGFSWKHTLAQLAWLCVPGLLLGGLWWGRNTALYGWPDFLGLLRHNAVVVNQPRTVEWVAREGLWPFLAGALRTTFRSFWGQFGWMGVVLDTRIYLGLGWLSALMVWGACWQLGESLSRGLTPRHRDALTLLGASALITTALYVGYNLTFVQHQGRYLFPALPALALAGAVGLQRLAEKRLAVGTALLLIVVLLGIGGVGLLRGDLPLWPLALTGTTVVALLVSGLLPRRFTPTLAGFLLAGLLALAVWCLFGFIVPLLG